MALPRKLKHMNLFEDGISYVGQVDEVELPKLTRKLEEFRAGGMNAPLHADHGMEAMSMSFTIGGINDITLRKFGTPTHDGVLLRFAGSYQRDDTGAVSAVEVVGRGRYKEIDLGSAKSGDNSSQKAELVLSYYKLTIDNEEIIEIDIINMIEIVDGVDHLAAHRNALGI